MKNSLRCWLMFGISLSVTPVGALYSLYRMEAETPAESSKKPMIMIWVYNYARVPGRTLAAAESEARRILGAAAVRVDWVQCPTSVEEVKNRPVCQERMSSAELAVTVFPTAKSVGTAYADKYFGFAQVFNNGQFGHYAYVFYDRVRDTAYVGQVPEGQLLASVICHEFGHLLMRSNTHSNSGIMRAQWNRHDLQDLTWGQLSFTPQEAEVIHSEALLRLRSSGGLSAVSPKPPPSSGR